MPKVIIMDVDGTLLNSKKEITSKTRDTLIKAQEIGIKLILASGRPTTGLYDFAKELKMDKYNGLLISFNGSKVVDFTTNNILFNKTMDVTDCKNVLEHLKKFKVKPMIDKDDYLYVNNVFDNIINLNNEPFNVIEYEARGGKFKLCEKDDLAAFVDYPLNKILIAGDPEYLKANYLKIMEPFKNTLNCMFTGPFYFEFTAKGIDKAKAIETVLIPMGYKNSDIVAFGDGENDISMIRYAGIGVAMGNAVDKLKDLADGITLSNEDDGIAVALYKYFPDLK